MARFAIHRIRHRNSSVCATVATAKNSPAARSASWWACPRLLSKSGEWSRHSADSGKPILRHFCPECGSSIAEEPSRRPGTIILNAGTLDDPSSVMPAVEIYCDRALPWVQLAGGMQRNRRGATGSTALGAGRAIPGAKAEWPQRVSDSTSYGEQRTPGHPSSPSVSFQR